MKTNSSLNQGLFFSITCLMILIGLFSHTSLQAQTVYDFTGGKNPTKTQKKKNRDNEGFDDFPYIQLSVASSIASPLGAFGATDDAPRSGFAGRGRGYNAQLNLYYAHWKGAQGEFSHNLGFILGWGWNKFSVKEDFERILDDRYSNDPDALATRWQAQRADWRGSHFYFGATYLLLIRRRLMVNIDASLGFTSLNSPEYRIEGGNYIPFNHGTFFEGTEVNLIDDFDTDAQAIGVYRLGMGYMITRRWGLQANVQLMHGNWRERAEYYTSTPSGAGVMLERTERVYTKPLAALQFQAGVCLSFGDEW